MGNQLTLGFHQVDQHGNADAVMVAISQNMSTLAKSVEAQQKLVSDKKVKKTPGFKKILDHIQRLILNASSWDFEHAATAPIEPLAKVFKQILIGSATSFLQFHNGYQVNFIPSSALTSVLYSGYFVWQKWGVSFFCGSPTAFDSSSYQNISLHLKLTEKRNNRCQHTERSETRWISAWKCEWCTGTITKLSEHQHIYLHEWIKHCSEHLELDSTHHAKQGDLCCTISKRLIFPHQSSLSSQQRYSNPSYILHSL